MFTNNNSPYKNSLSKLESDTSITIADSSFNIVNYQILDYNINLVNDVLSKIFSIICENTNIKRKYFCINYKFDGAYKEFLIVCVSIIEYLESVLPILKITKPKIYLELVESNSCFKSMKENELNFLISNIFNIFSKLPGNFDWSREIKKLAESHKRNINYVFETINDKNLIGYNTEGTYKDLLQISDSFEGTPIKKRCLVRDEKKELDNSRDDLFFDVPEIDMTNSIFNNEDLEEIDMTDSTFNGEDSEEISIVSSVIKNKSKNDLEISSEESIISEDQYTKEQEVTFTKISKTNDKIRNEAFHESLIESYKDDLEIRTIKFEDLPQNVVKIAEASFSEVFKSNNLIYKIVPIGRNCNTSIIDFIRESRVLKILNKEKGVSILRDILIVKGPYTTNYLKAWDNYGFEENQRPDFYKKTQKFGVLVTEDGGICLEKYKFKTVKEIVSVITQIANILSILEIKYKFEHRDLHWGNILIHNGNIQIIDFALSRLNCVKDGSFEIIYKDLTEINWVFDGDEKIDEQYGIYREMRDFTRNDWSKFCPVTSVLWMRYLVSKLFDQVKIKKSISLKEKYLEILKSCTSISEFYKRM